MPFTLILLPETLAVCRLSAAAPVPEWALRGPFFSITRTATELSVVCPEAAVPAATRVEPGWRIFQIEGVLDFAMTGVISSLTAPLAAADVSVFVLSTFDTDYVLVKTAKLDQTIQLWRVAGHTVQTAALSF